MTPVRATTAVLDRLTAAPTANAGPARMPSAIAAAMPAATVSATCSAPAAKVLAPKARSRATLNSVPIEKSRVEAPSSAIACTRSPPSTQPSTFGPATVPASR